ncbi:DNA topoisomerase IV subunit B, partial [candidate division WWE3 bacterium]|nr:DNA topoisomerase IV subunit B [candidate division WWE3 bacterium]
AFLTAGIKFEVIDYRDDTHYSYYFEGGLKTYLKALNRNKTPVTKNIFYTKGESNEVEVEVAFQYTDTYSDNVLAFANHIKTPGGGTHLTGFRTALTKTINDYARKKGLLKEKDDNLSGDDLKEGLNAIISIKLESDILQFEGQTKDKLGNSHVRPAVEAVMKDSLETFFEENPKDAQAIIEKNLLALKARMAAKAARDTVIRKSALEGGGVLPGKLSDCSSKDREKTELFIVEGDSAGGTARQGRDRTTQAILPLFGKILNTERARLDKVIDNDKLKNLIVAMGAGIGEQYDASKLRYGKLIIMADADIDGAHIATLYLTFFYRHMRELIENGHVYVAMPPLFKATWGKNKQYIQDETEHAKFLETTEGKSAIIQRFKGLGEMNEEELWETTMNPETRTLRKLSIEDAEKADEVFSMLMGSEVAPRKRFIQTHSKDADVDY